MTRIIEIEGTNIRIEVTNAHEMFLIFARLHGWETLRVRSNTSIVHDLYPCNTDHWFTESYFKKLYFS